jgi:hypothetical protein
MRGALWQMLPCYTLAVRNQVLRLFDKWFVCNFGSLLARIPISVLRGKRIATFLIRL